jgi:acetyl-CoA synthetase
MAEVAVIGVPDELTGQAICAFVSLNKALGAEEARQIAKDQVAANIGKFASPKHVVVVQDLPKNRAGKILRRLLRKIWCGEGDQLGNLTTPVDPTVIGALILAVDSDGLPEVEDAVQGQRVSYVEVSNSPIVVHVAAQT